MLHPLLSFYCNALYPNTTPQNLSLFQYRGHYRSEMENYASVAPTSPPHSFPEHDAPLGSSLASPGHSYQQYWQSRRKYLDTTHQPHSSATIREGEIGSDQKFSEFPSFSQQAALTTLQDCDTGTICAWLTGLRSGENWFQPSCLSVQQLEAISALKDCTNSLVSAWLDHIRRGGQYPSQCRMNDQFPNATAQEISVRFTVTMVTATSLSRDRPQHRHAIRGKNRQIHPGPHPALSAPLRLFTTVAPVSVHNAVRGVEEPFSTSPKSLPLVRTLPYRPSPPHIPIGALSARSLECSLPVMDGRDI